MLAVLLLVGSAASVGVMVCVLAALRAAGRADARMARIRQKAERSRDEPSGPPDGSDAP